LDKFKIMINNLSIIEEMNHNVKVKVMKNINNKESLKINGEYFKIKINKAKVT